MNPRAAASRQPTHPLEQQLAAAWPPERWRSVGVVAAVSGGADSLALLRALFALTPDRLTVAHFNHRLRQEQSDADEQFVVDCCRQLDIECLVGHAQPWTSQPDGLEAAARCARYAFLRQTAERLGARYLATAHTANDQAETVLHHVLRGTGLAGLAGMPAARPLGEAVTLVRPMLSIRRQEVLAYLESLGQTYRDDPTNRDRQFTRSRMRHELFPLIERDYAPRAVESLLRLASLAADAQRTIQRFAERLLDQSIVQVNPAQVVLNTRVLAAEDRHLVREALLVAWRRQNWPLQAMGHAQWELLAEMVFEPLGDDGAARRRMFPGAVTATRQGEQLLLAAPEAGQEETETARRPAGDL